ncbi:MAG: caspase family protein [Rubrivivax sp.]|nr:caspase family protein [Rubrivivax sp.]
MNMRFLAAWVGAWVLWCAPGSVWSAECPERFRIVFADGARSCLTDHALAHDDVAGQFGADVRRLVPRTGVYALAATPNRPECRRAVGMDLVAAGTNPSSMSGDAQRDAKALQDCRLRARGATDDCRCKVLLVDGRSPLTRAEFARYADAAPAAAGASAAPAGAAPPPPVAGMVPPASSTGGRAPGVPPSAEDLAVLRQEIEVLRAQMAAGRPSSAGSAAGPERKAQKARALVIGNSRYVHLGILANPRRDAEAIATKLRSFGIDVDLHLDLDRAGLVKALAGFQTRAAGHDVNLLFYAGHGLQMAGINYIVPVDMQTEGATTGTVKLNGVSLDDALDYLPANTRVVFLDACRDNPISRSLRSTRSGVGTGLAPVSSVSGTLLSYATRDGSTAEDGAGTNSPYTTALLQHLDQPEDIALVLRRVRQSVLQSTSQRQEPWEYGSLVGDQLVLSRLAR